MNRCPCGERKAPRQFLCRGCWFGLTVETRRRLRLADDKARARAVALFRAIRAATPLREIEVPA